MSGQKCCCKAALAPRLPSTTARCTSSRRGSSFVLIGHASLFLFQCGQMNCVHGSCVVWFACLISDVFGVGDAVMAVNDEDGWLQFVWLVAGVEPDTIVVCELFGAMRGQGLVQNTGGI